MFNKLRDLLKLNNVKRILIVGFSFIFVGLFVGLSFGFYSKKTTPSIQYQNGIQVVVKPTNIDNSPISDNQVYVNQIYYNLSSRLKQKYPNNYINIEKEGQNTFNIKVAGINTEESKNEFIKYLVNKNEITLRSIDDKYNDYPFYNDIVNSLFVDASLEQNKLSYNLKFETNQSNELYKAAKAKGVSKIVIWKNFNIFKQIIDSILRDKNNKDEKDDFINSGQNYYRYLWQDGKSPEFSQTTKDGSENSTNKYYFFKEEIALKDQNGNIIKSYHPTDFIMAIIDVEKLNNASTLLIEKNFQANNWNPTTYFVKDEYEVIKYSVSPYNFDNYMVSSLRSEASSNAFPLFIIILVTFFTIISIFVVINYGYLGIIALLLLAIIIFLSLLMITVMIGDYDTTTILSIVISTIISFDFIILFFEKIKKEIKKGNSISKATKNTIKLTNKSDYIKAILLAISIAIIYVFLSSLYGTFSMIVLVTLIAIPIVMILFLRLLTKIFVEIKWFENNKKTIGFWKKDFKLSQHVSFNENEKNFIEQINEEKKDDHILKTTSGYKIFRKLNNKGWLLSLCSLAYLIFGGLIAFTISLVKTNNGFTSSINDRNLIVLRISSFNNNLDKQKISNELNKLAKDEIVKIDTSTENIINAYFDKNCDQSKLNKITDNLISKYKVKIIQSNLLGSETYRIMLYTLYGILLAIIAMGIFILLWLNWSKALAFLIISIIFTIVIFALLMFGLITLNPFTSSIIICSFIIFVLTTLTSLIKYDQKFKNKKIEQMNSESIKKTIDLVTFKNMKLTIITNTIALISFLLFGIFNVLPIIPMIFISLFIMFNLIFNIFLLPKLLIKFESIRAKSIRKKIINKYWDTEKIHEQGFSNINNIK